MHINTHKLLRTAALLLVIPALSAVGSCRHVITDFQLQLDVEVDGTPSEFQPGRIFDVPRPQGHLSPFPSVGYEDELVRIQFSLASYRSGIRINNMQDVRMTVHWDEALISSSQRPNPTQFTGFYRSMEGRYFDPPGAYVEGPFPAQSISPNGQGSLGFRLVPEKLFESREMFGIVPAGSGLNLDDDGTGNWVDISVPIEVAGERIVYRFRFTVRDAHRRWSYA